MDVGFYLGELLVQQGEVSVPGLGYFVKVRMGGYYNEAERKFYPPFHQAQFDPQFIEDEALANYIANKKNISVASAKYFSEKYITGLKEQALQTEVSIGDMGWFYTEQDRLTFKPADKLNGDNAFFGLQPVSISKTANAGASAQDQEAGTGVKTVQVILTPPPVVLPPDVPVPEPIIPPTPLVTEQTPAYIPAPVTDDEPEYVYSPDEPVVSLDLAGEEYVPEENNKTLRILLIVFAAVAIICVSVYAVYRYQPDVFAKVAFWQQQAPKPVDTVKPKVVAPVKPDTAAATDSIKADTTAAVKKDTVAKVEAPVAKKPTVTTPPVTTAPKQPVVTTPAPAVKTPVTEVADADVPTSPAIGTRRFEVYVSSVKSMEKVKLAMEKLKANGLKAWYVSDAPGTLKHVSIGVFPTYKEAKAFAAKSIESGKVPGGDAYPMEIIPQK